MQGDKAPCKAMVSFMITGNQFRDAVISGANTIAAHRREVDELNVFPVPDGDTGTNMSMTIGAAPARGACTRLQDPTVEHAAQRTPPPALLRGARGNSGVILSLLFRGYFQRPARGKEERRRSFELAAALSAGVDAAYKAVMKPTEGHHSHCRARGG